MKKALIILVGIICACVIVANMDYLKEIMNAVQGGALTPLVVACFIMLARYVVQAISYNAAFEAVEHPTGIGHNVILIFSLVFINTFCMFGGATGVAFIIDDARRKGMDVGTATSGAILSQIGWYVAVFAISVIGFVSMMISGMINFVFVVGALLLFLVLVALVSLYVLGYVQPQLLRGLFEVIEKAARKVLRVFKRDLVEGWGKSNADSFSRNARVLAGNPRGAMITVMYATASALLNMFCLIAIGFAFGYEQVGPMIAAFALATISVLLSPTPQGVGVVEAAIVAVLCGAGCDLTAATAISLVYRGIIFWIPFCVGAVMLSQSGFFKGKKNPTENERAREAGWIGGTIVGVIAVVNLIMALLPQLSAPYSLLVQWIDIGNMFAGQALVLSGLVLLAIAIGLVFRQRLAWAFAITALTLIAGFEFVYYNTVMVALILIVVASWLFLKRDCFSLHLGDLPFYQSLIGDEPTFHKPGHTRPHRRGKGSSKEEVDVAPSKDSDSVEQGDGAARKG